MRFKRTPLANLHLTLMDQFGASIEVVWATAPERFRIYSAL